MRRDNVLPVVAILATALFLFATQIAISKRNFPDPKVFCKGRTLSSPGNRDIDKSDEESLETPIPRAREKKADNASGNEDGQRVGKEIAVPEPPEPLDRELYEDAEYEYEYKEPPETPKEEEDEKKSVPAEPREPQIPLAPGVTLIPARNVGRRKRCEVANPYRLVGPVKVPTEPVDEEDLQLNLQYSGVTLGGKFEHAHCEPRQRVAVVLAHRHREASLRVFLSHIIPILLRQDVDFQFFLVHQGDAQLFNKAVLYNAGFLEASKVDDWDCYLFHDVDMLLENDKLSMTCTGNPVHFSVAVNEFDYKLPYKFIFGGVVALTEEHMWKVNGFSNQFWGWGGEDDDMWNRIADKGLTVNRPTTEMGRFTMVKHKKSVKSPLRVYDIMKGKEYYDTDGLNNVKYEVLSIEKTSFYTNITVSPQKVIPVNAPTGDGKFDELSKIHG